MSQLRWTTILLDELSRQGVGHAVISPGSRSTPLTIAAALHPALETHVVLDERSAGFIALGIGKKTGRPALLICTSGTAGTNYYPAVTEARESGVPMIILTADRPPNLRKTGSSQTIDQTKMYGDQAVFFFDAGELQNRERDEQRLAYLASQLVEESVIKGGAAHLNMPFRKPLEPDADELSDVKKDLADRKDKPGRKFSASTSRIYPDEEILRLISSSERPLIIAGPSNPFHCLDGQALGVSEQLGAPVLSEPGSGFRGSGFSICRYEQFLRNEEALKALRPDLILRFGDQPFTASLLHALNVWADVPVIHFASRSSVQDHTLSVRYTIDCRRQDRLDIGPVQSSTEKSWMENWKEAERTAEEKMDKVLKDSRFFTDGHVFYLIGERLCRKNSNWHVMLSNSFPARDMALFGKSAAGQFVNRGAAGIDGITSTALGICLSSRQPTCCLTGDLAFLHDSNALLSLRSTDGPMVLIVINNGGGTIFRMLPVYRQKDIYRDFFETPQHADIEKLAGAYGLEYQKISSVGELAKVELDLISGVKIIECVTDASESMKLRKKLWGG